MNVDVSNISSFSELKSVYEAIEKDEESIKNEINELCVRKVSLAEDMSKLEVAIPNLELLESNSYVLSNMILVAAELAESVSGKVRQLDLAKNRVQQCINRVEDILDLKACTEGSQKSMNEGEYDSAANFVKRYLEMDENILKLTESEAENSLKILHDTTVQLKDIANNSFDKAVKVDDFSGIERFLKIFPQIGESRMGLEKFACYLSSKINAEMRGQIKLTDVSDPQRHDVKYVDLMTTLLETVAGIIKKYQPYIESYYKPGELQVFLSVIQKECDTWSLTVLDKFKKERNFNEILINIRSSGPDKPDPLELGALITELVNINTRVELYQRFVRRLLQTDLVATQNKTSNEINEECNKFFSDSKLINEMQSIINNYILMEEFFLKQMILKAISDTELENSVVVSNTVDGVFFVVNQCLRRTLSSGSMEGMCAMLNLAGMILSEEYATRALRNRIRQVGLSSGSAWMRDAYSYMQAGVSSGSAAAQISSGMATAGVVGVGSGGVVGSSTAVTATNPSSSATTNVGALSGGGSSVSSSGSVRQQKFLLHVNNAEVSIECMETLRDGLEKEFAIHCQKMETTTISKLNECLSGMCCGVMDKFRETVDSALSEFATAILKPQIKTFSQDLSSIKFILNEEDYLFHEANDPWVEHFIINIQSLLTEFKETVVVSLYDKIIQKVCEEVVYRIEKIIKSKSFNKLGGIQFDRDIRTLINFFSTATTWGVRDKFSRLRQIANILNLESVSEISSYWETMSWRLNPKEVKEFMALRSDFRTEDIRKLTLF